MEPTDPDASTPDDWTPWSTPEPAEGEPGAGEVDDAARPAATPAAPVVSTAPQPRRSRAAAAPMPAARVQPSFSIGGIIAAVGGLVIVGGSLLEMVKVGIGPNQLVTTTLSTNYFDTDNGKIVAALGAVVLVLALATLVRPAASIFFPILVAAAGLAAAGLALSDRLDLSNVGDDYRHHLFPGNQLRGLVHVTVGPALYVVMGGGVIATIGAVLRSVRSLIDALAG